MQGAAVNYSMDIRSSFIMFFTSVSNCFDHRREVLFLIYPPFANSNWSERICVLPRLSTSLKDSAKFDLLITETFDAGLFGEHIAETLDHAHKKLLHNNSKIIPRGAKVFAGLLECGFLERQHSFTSNSCGPLDFSALRLESTMPREYLATVNYTKLMECYDPYDTIDLPNMPPDQFKIVSDPVQIGDVFDFEDSDQVARWLGERTSYREELQ